MNKLDQHIKNKLSQPQVPPLDAWKNIQEKLDEKEKKRQIIPLFYWIGSTAACLVIGIGVFYFNQEETNSSNKPAQEVVKNNSNSSLEKQQSSKSNKNNSDTIEQNSIHNQVKEENTLNENSLQLTHKETKQNNTIHLENNSPTYTTTSTEEKRMLVVEKPQKSLFFDGKGDAFVIFPEKLSAENTIISQPKFEQNNIAKSKKDSITKKEILDQILNEKPLELVLEEEQKEVEKKKEKINISSPKFVVSSYVNPTKMLDSKSILSDEFNQNNINNSLTIAYGAKVAIRLNDKMNIRSGISKIELEQHTNSVGTMSNNAMAYLANSNINLNAQNNIKYDQNYTRVLANNNVGTMLSSSMGEMEQQIHYVEIPLELEYKLANFKKFNLLATAGGSYYLVTKNQISLKDTNSRSVRIGEASNLNDMNYSANAGLKLEYLLSEKTSINLEPNYRYMINTLHNVETRNPSLLGLNLGFSIKF